MKTIKKCSLLLMLPLLLACSNKAYLGTYIYSYYGSDSSFAQLDLKKDKSFTYYASSCMASCSSRKGVGNYSIKEDTIQLNYLENPDKNLPINNENSLLSLEQRPTKSASKLTVKAVEIIQADTIPLIYANILCKTQLENKGTTTSFEGVAKFSLSANDFPVEIEVQYIGFLPSTVILEEHSMDYDLVVSCIPVDDNLPYWLEGKQRFPILKEENGLRISNMTKPFKN